MIQENRGDIIDENQNNSDISLSQFLLSPLPSSTNDESAVKKTVEDSKLIPKYRTGSGVSITFLDVISNLFRVSSPFLACVSSIQGYAFGGDITAQKNRTIGVKSFDETAVGDTEILALENSISRIGVSFSDIVELTKNMQRAQKEVGNTFLLVTISTVNKVSKVSLQYIHYTNFMYVSYEKIRNNRFGVIANSFNDSNFSMKNARIVAVSTQKNVHFKEIDKNTVETLIHFSWGANNGLYGKSALEDHKAKLYEDWLIDMWLNRVGGTMLNTGGIYAIPSEPKTAINTQTQGKSSLEKLRGELDKTTLASSDSSKQIAVHTFNATQGTPVFFPININRDVPFLEARQKRNINTICSLMDWKATLAGLSDAPSGLGSDREIKELLIYNAKTILPAQEEWEKNWSFIFSTIGNVISDKVLIDSTIKFPRRIEELVSLLKNENGSQTIT